ncbi:MAG: hypothetical protein P4L77_12140 [Sulfuriferula sp.]|nr:hypothetical protein [Sulfuriferula sp.]
MSFQLGNKSTSVDAKALAIARLKASASGVKPEDGAIIRYIAPGDCPDRSRLVFDDSGSMGNQIENAKTGVIEYLRNCIPNQTAVAIHFMNTRDWSTALNSNLLQLAQDIREAKLNSGGTPFFNTIKKALEAKPVLTRLVVFTDGSPTDSLQAEAEEKSTIFDMQDYHSFNQNPWIASADIIIKIALAVGGGEKHIPIDTVFFGPSYRTTEIALLKYLSDHTGGFFLHFDPSKPGIWKQLKYLAPVNRLMLTDGAFRARIERGE